jgi:hypothetical protein
VRETSGQTVHLFSEPYLRGLLTGCAHVDLEPVEITEPDTGEPFQRIRRGVAHRGQFAPPRIDDNSSAHNLNASQRSSA